MKTRYQIYLLGVWLQLMTLDMVFALNAPCNSSLVTGPLGVEDHALTGSLPYHNDHRGHPKYARLSAPYGHAFIGSFLQVRLRKQSVITGFLTQGRHGLNQYVEEYNVMYSDNGTAWQEVKDNNGIVKTFIGNSDSSSVSESTLSDPITASYIRVNLKKYNSHPAVRLEILGCPILQAGNPTCWKANYVTGIPSSDMFGTTRANPGECGKECHGQETCHAFTFNQGSGLCQGHSYTKYVNANIQLTATSGGSDTSLLFVKQEACPGDFTSLK